MHGIKKVQPVEKVQQLDFFDTIIFNGYTITLADGTVMQ